MLKFITLAHIIFWTVAAVLDFEFEFNLFLIYPICLTVSSHLLKTYKLDVTHKAGKDCLKFHFWNLNGYSDLSAVEGIIGGWEGEWEGEETRGIQLGVKVTNGANVGRR